MQLLDGGVEDDFNLAVAARNLRNRTKLMPLEGMVEADDINLAA